MLRINPLWVNISYLLRPSFPLSSAAVQQFATVSSIGSRSMEKLVCGETADWFDRSLWQNICLIEFQVYSTNTKEFLRFPELQLQQAQLDFEKYEIDAQKAAVHWIITFFLPSGIKPNFENVYYALTMRNGARGNDKTYMSIKIQKKKMDALNMMGSHVLLIDARRIESKCRPIYLHV